MDTLGVQLSPSHYRAGSGLSPFRFRPCRAHYEGAVSLKKIAQIKELSFRASAHTGVGIPRSEGEPPDKDPKNRGDCHTSDIGHWFAMTAFFFYVLFDETFP